MVAVPMRLMNLQETGEQLYAIEDCCCNQDHNANGRECRALPDGVGYEGNLAVPLAMSHPEHKCWDQNDADAKEGDAQALLNASDVG